MTRLDDAPKDPSLDVPEPPEVILVDHHRVSCDGGNGALGHPKVWYEIGEEGFVDCGYCDRRFVLRGPAGDGAAH